MSICALQWAFKQRTGKAQSKSVLISLSERANEEFECWPSIRRLELDTELNRKTIIKCLDHLESAGFIADTGRRKGKTNSVKIYKLVGCAGREESDTKNGTALAAPAKPKKASKAVPKTAPLTGTKNGTAKQSQKRDSSKAKAVPKTVSVSSPKNGTENHTSLEPHIGSNNPESLQSVPKAPERKPATETPPGFDDFKIPEWLDPELWATWENYRRHRIAQPWDDLAKAESLGELHKANQRGQDLRMVIRNAMIRHWKHPYPLKSSVGADIPLDAIRDAYKRICVPAGMLECEEMYPELESLIARRVRDGGMTVGDWECFFQHAAKKPELTGKLPPRLGFDTPFRATLHSLLENKRFAKLDAEIRTEMLA